MNAQYISRFASYACLSILLSLGTLSALGETNTNDVIDLMIVEEDYGDSLSKAPGKNDLFLDHLTWQIPIHGKRRGLYELGHTAHITILQESLQERYGRESIQGRGEQIFVDTLVHSLRDSFIGWLNLDRFKKESRPVNYFSTKLIEGSVAGTLEESRRDALSLDPTSVESTREWINSFTPRNRVQFGIRLDQTYAYMSIAIGSQRGKKPLLLLNTRLHSVIQKDGVPSIKEEILIPLGQRTQVSLGASCYPTKFDGQGFENRFAARISTEINKSAFAYFSVGESGGVQLAHVAFSKSF